MNWKKPLLIIGGTTKAGTTSLFDWLSEHPEVGAAKIKETRYFLDDIYPLPKLESDLNNPEKYMKFFNSIDIDRDCVLLDATPDYMYCDAPLSIPSIYSEAKMVLILRDPVERFVSWYFYAKQRAFIPNSSTLSDFLKLQIADVTPNKPSYCYALHQGIYEPYLAKLRLSYGDNLLILQFEELKKDPKSVMLKICKFSNLDSDYFDDFNFTVSNKTVELANPSIAKLYNQIRLKVTFAVLEKDWVIALLRVVNRPIRAVLERSQSNVGRREVISDIDMNMIKKFYKANTSKFLENL